MKKNLMGDLMPVPVGIAQKLIPTQHQFKVQTQQNNNNTLE